MKTQIQFLFKWSREILNNHSDKLREKARKRVITHLFVLTLHVFVKNKKVRTDEGFSLRVRVGRGEVEKDLHGFLLSYYDKRITFNLRKHIYFKRFSVAIVRCSYTRVW